MIEEMILFIALIIIFPIGVVIGWLQRDRDKERDATKLAKHILKS